MKPSWHPNRTQHQYQLRKANIQKKLEQFMNHQHVWVPRVEVGIEIRSNIDQTWKPTWSASWDRFLIDFGTQVGAQNPPKRVPSPPKGSPIDLFLKASWKVIFFGQEALKKARWRTKMVRLADCAGSWGGLRRGMKGDSGFNLWILELGIRRYVT